MSSPLPPPPDAPEECGPICRQTTLIVIDSRTAIDVTRGVGGKGSITFGTYSSNLNVIVTSLDEARRLHEKTGTLLTDLEHQARTEPRLQAVRDA